MTRIFKLALAVSLAAHVALFAIVRSMPRGGSQPLPKTPVETILVMLPEREDPPEEKPAPPPPPPIPEKIPPVPAPQPAPPPVTPPAPPPVVAPPAIKPVPPPEPRRVEPPAPTIPAPVEQTAAPTSPAPHVVVASPAPSTPAVLPPPPVIASQTTPSAVPSLHIGPVQYRRKVEPEYPLLARRRRQEGVVLLEVTIAADGRATHVTVKQSSGFPLLDRAAEEAARQSEFDLPSSQTMRAEVPVRFMLKK